MKSFRKRFPPPWRVEKYPAGYSVLDSKGEKIISAFAYSDDLVKSTGGRGKLSWAQAHALAKAICTLASTQPDEGK